MSGRHASRPPVGDSGTELAGELALYVARERAIARAYLRRLIAGLVATYGLGPTPAQQQRHAEEAADERRWSRAD